MLYGGWNFSMRKPHVKRTTRPTSLWPTSGGHVLQQLDLRSGRCRRKWFLWSKGSPGNRSSAAAIVSMKSCEVYTSIKHYKAMNINGLNMTTLLVIGFLSATWRLSWVLHDKNHANEAFNCVCVYVFTTVAIWGCHGMPRNRNTPKLFVLQRKIPI